MNPQQHARIVHQRKIEEGNRQLPPIIEDERLQTSINPRFRVVLNGVPGLERPAQCFGNSSEDLAKWADAVLRTYLSNIETSSVTIYERFEVERCEIRLTTQSPNPSDSPDKPLSPKTSAV